MARRGKKEGTIGFHKPSGKWRARVTVGYDAKGNPKQRAVYGVTREEAAAKLTELMAKQSQGLLAEPSKLTVSQWFDKWLEGKRHLSSRTRANYQHVMNKMTPTIGREKLQKLTPAMVRGCIDAIAAQGIAIKTQKYALTVLRSALREAVGLEIITRNPAEAVRLRGPRVPEDKMQPWSADEVATFLERAAGDLRYPVFYTMLALGLRRGEVLGLRWQDVNFTEGKVSIRQTLALPGDRETPVIKTVKTPKSRRTLYLPVDVLSLLEGVKAKQAENREKLHDLWQDTGLIFTTAYGRPIHPRNLTRSFKRLCKVSGVRPIRLHDLRHTYASLALKRGVPVEVVSERLGHASVGFTLDVYRHLYEAERKEAALSLADLMQPRAAPN